MKKFLLLGMLSPFLVQAQWHVNILGGFSNYIGDLQRRGYTTQQAHFAFSGGLQYDLSAHFSILGNLSYAKVGASDAYSNKPDVVARNLSFQSRIYEGNLLLEYNLLDLNQHRFTPYAFGGFALYHFNPFAFDSLGHKLYLRQLSTEGEGLAAYPDRKPYNLTQIAIPFGGGIKMRVTDNVVIAYEIGLRKLFTDYLDDVSTTYVDRATLLAARGPDAVKMAYRGSELKTGGAYPEDGTIRGNHKTKDWYYISGIRITIGINTRRGVQEYRRRKGVYDCPEKVY
ncbi:DUF6089 family protein [Flavitalea sp. BT771]|uniref:DUF6089 family protein n=1 Tax=Flavitalea sp. BT771 TaxID=3063329 RepID=UPI0026E2F930|nr:DUF6089 family protein [Flavitalea sp. BT771]MDO6434525.1 DUF6089 family protein [Flavitalea sp. BT771]MDV6223425.1 DUF6089 family protein [Flavitalea sp. BT771]